MYRLATILHVTDDDDDRRNTVPTARLLVRSTKKHRIKGCKYWHYSFTIFCTENNLQQAHQ